MNHFKTKNNKREKLRGIYFQLGLIIAGGLTLLAFEWTFPIHVSELGGVIIEEIEEDFEWTPAVEKEKVKIKIETFEEVKSKSELFKKVENDFKEKEVDKKAEKILEKTPDFKEGEWKEVEKVKEVAPMGFAESMPYYKDCKDLKENERKECTQENMYKHFGKNIRVPEIIKMKGKATYLAFVYFEVNKKGKITNVKILNDEKHKIPKELEREAYNAVSSLPQMIPAKHNGKKVKVLYKVPIKFTIR
jgi:hypothetical protein